MSYDVNEVIKRLDRYPNFAVEIGGRTRYLMFSSNTRTGFCMVRILVPDYLVQMEITSQMNR
ncbi:MAG: hypothetical protein AMS23_07820 [Bacteroides sp. SM1_62]|nr:MAG: hypothetical protein AMS23_07820 [Bacteroides sp. SM1_62]